MGIARRPARSVSTAPIVRQSPKFGARSELQAVVGPDMNARSPAAARTPTHHGSKYISGAYRRSSKCIYRRLCPTEVNSCEHRQCYSTRQAFGPNSKINS